MSFKQMHGRRHENSIGYKAQISMEFVLLMAMSFFIIIIFLMAAYSLSEASSDMQNYNQLNDFGASLQSEILLASELEDGYRRFINVPERINGLSYGLEIGQSSPYNGYATITYGGAEIYFLIPPVNGTIIKGKNTLYKNNGTLYISQ